MLKRHDQMWTRLSRLPKQLPAWVAASFSGNASQHPKEDRPPLPTDRVEHVLDKDTALQVLTETAATEELIEEPSEAVPSENLIIPIRSECAETAMRHALQDKGQFLARQERWSELSQLIRTADMAHSRTSGGLPEADLLSYGGRADVVNAVEHALQEAAARSGPSPEPRSKSRENRILIDGVMALEALRHEHRQDSYLTAIVAQAHIDIAWIWRRAEPAGSEAHLRRASAHFERAATLLTPLKEESKNSAFLSAARCALFAGQRTETLVVADAYAALIDQNPSNPRPMRTLGTQMLPRANGSYAALELEARRTAARTQSTWGAGGYTWVYFDAMAIDEQACARVDPEFFLDGLQDILCTDPSQEMINLLAAYCAVTLSNGFGLCTAADQNRSKISASARWLVRSHLHELHPLIWAHAVEGFDNSARVTSLRRFSALGQVQAFQCLTRIFQDELDSGHKVTFSPEGFDLLPG